MDDKIGREERVQLLKFVIALMLFVCALHVLCSRDNQAALAQIQRPHAQSVSAAVPGTSPVSAKEHALLMDKSSERIAM